MPQTSGSTTMDPLSFNTRKSLCNHLGDLAGIELAEFLQQLKMRLELVERNKVDVTRIIPESMAMDGSSDERNLV
jgi:hypothetical protein